MTREEVKELLPIIQAFAAGKQIQDSIDCVRWFDTDEINLEYEGQKIKHRIKPEPEYRPFKTQEECWNEMLKHQPFGWIFNKETECYVYPVLYTSITAVFTDKSTANFNSIFENYTFADGKPFGIKEK